MIDWSVLAAYAVLLTASLLVEHRRLDTALLRSRGAGPLRIALLGLAKGAARHPRGARRAAGSPWRRWSSSTLPGRSPTSALQIVPQVTVEGYLAGRCRAACVPCC